MNMRIIRFGVFLQTLEQFRAGNFSKLHTMFCIALENIYKALRHVRFIAAVYFIRG